MKISFKNLGKNTDAFGQTKAKRMNSQFPGGSEGKAPACNAGDLGSIPGLGSSPGEGNGNPLQYPAWRIPWTKTPGGLQSIEPQRVRYD